MAISDISAKRKPQLWQTCATCHLLGSLPDEEAGTLIDLLSDVSVRYGWLADELTKDGHPIDWQALSRHARGQCQARVKLRAARA